MATERTEREERNKATLVEKARHLFYVEGYSHLGMETLAFRLGTSKATLYKYFPSRERLVAAVVDRQIEAISRALDSLMEGKSTFDDRFLSFLDILFKSILPAVRFFMRDLVRSDPAQWERIVIFRREKVFVVLSSLLEQGTKAGLVRRDVRGETISPLLVAIIEQFGRPEVILDLPFSQEDAIRSFVRILLQGILSDAGREEFGRIGSIYFKAPPLPADGAKGPRV